MPHVSPSSAPDGSPSRSEDTPSEDSTSRRLPGLPILDSLAGQVVRRSVLWTICTVIVCLGGLIALTAKYSVDDTVQVTGVARIVSTWSGAAIPGGTIQAVPSTALGQPPRLRYTPNAPTSNALTPKGDDRPDDDRPDDEPFLFQSESRAEVVLSVAAAAAASVDVDDTVVLKSSSVRPVQGRVIAVDPSPSAAAAPDARQIHVSLPAEALDRFATQGGRVTGYVQVGEVPAARRLLNALLPESWLRDRFSDLRGVFAADA